MPFEFTNKFKELNDRKRLVVSELHSKRGAWDVKEQWKMYKEHTMRNIELWREVRAHILRFPSIDSRQKLTNVPVCENKLPDGAYREPKWTQNRKKPYCIQGTLTHQDTYLLGIKWKGCFCNLRFLTSHRNTIFEETKWNTLIESHSRLTIIFLKFLFHRKAYKIFYIDDTYSFDRNVPVFKFHFSAPPFSLAQRINC